MCHVVYLGCLPSAVGGDGFFFSESLQGRLNSVTMTVLLYLTSNMCSNVPFMATKSICYVDVLGELRQCFPFKCQGADGVYSLRKMLTRLTPATAF